MTMDGAAAVKPLTKAELCCWLNFLNAQTNLSRLLDAELLASHRLSLAEFIVLQQLVLGGGHLRMSELAETVQLSPSGASRLVDRMVAAGLIERRPCNLDGRVTYAAITERGRARVAEAEPTQAAALRRLFLDLFSPEQLQDFTDLLMRVAPACRAWRAGA